MKPVHWLAGGILLLGVAAFFGIRHASQARAESTDGARPIRPVVVELFTSEGCSSCPPADALLRKLDEEQRPGNAEIIALEEHVDYWDQLGWRDPFSSAEWTRRQEAYAATFRNEGVYTPQMVVDGRTEFVGSSRGRALSAISEASRVEKADIKLSKVQAVGSTAHLKIEVKMLPRADSSEAQVWLAVTETGLHSNVKQGENKGEDLHHAAVVRSMRNVGALKGMEAIAYSAEQEVTLDASWKPQEIRLVVFVQDPKSRHILGAATTHLAQ